ncbi:MAG: AAA family ATPase [Prevotella sp.]|jgi:predicted ATPase|nr:AAA family ATPase [Prevotella sp.]
MINNIKISGYKSIKEMDLDLLPINILIGSNGVGKSNFISFFKLVNNLYEKNLERYSIEEGVDRLMYYGRKHTDTIHGYLNFGYNQYDFKLGANKGGSLYIKEETSLCSGHSDNYPQHNEQESYVKDSSYTRNRFLSEQFESFKIYHFHDTEANSKLRSICKIDDNQFLKVNGSNLPAFLYYLQEKAPKSLKRIEANIRSVMPYFEGFDLHPRKLNPEEIQLEWKDETDLDEFFTAMDLSDGSLRFIALSTLLMQPDLPNTILIDEPELGLHPVAIAKLAGLIKSAAARNCQMIISTQSVDLINHFNPEDVITVDRKDGQSVFSRLNGTELEHWLEDYSLGELWSKSVINGQPGI